MSILLTETAFTWNAYETLKGPTLYQATENIKTEALKFQKSRNHTSRNLQLQCHKLVWVSDTKTAATCQLRPRPIRH